MNDIKRYRYRMLYSKTEAMRYTSHLDLHRTWERSLRRAGLPLAYSQGYNPRPRLNLGHALPLGYTSDYELADFWLETLIDSKELRRTIRPALPPGLRLHEVSLYPARQPALQQQIASCVYKIRLEDSPDDATLQTAIERLIQAEILPRIRRGKSYNLRPLIETIDLQPVQGHMGLVMQLSAREGRTGRPDEVLLEMGLDPTHAHIHRTQQVLQQTT